MKVNLPLQDKRRIENVVNFYLLFCRLLVISSSIVLIAGCSNLPRDPKKTSEHVQDGTLRVGLVENPPWVIRTNGEPAGAEVELVRRFAKKMNATPEWNWGNEQQHFEALESFQLDLAIGGFNDSTPWSTRIGLTSPYFENRIVVGVPPSMQPPSDINGKQIEVERGESTGSYLEKKGAIPVKVEELSKAGTFPAAASEWKLERLGFTATELNLHTEQHIMIVAPGENGFIKRLDEFLSDQSAGVKSLLQQEDAQRMIQQEGAK